MDYENNEGDDDDGDVGANRNGDQGGELQMFLFLKYGNCDGGRDSDDCDVGQSCQNATNATHHTLA